MYQCTVHALAVAPFFVACTALVHHGCGCGSSSSLIYGRGVVCQLADQLTEIVTDAVLAIRVPGQPIDLHMVERMHVSPCTPLM
jgi:hypothetical protein